MITLHHLNNSRSHRILWFLEELGVDYDIKYYQREATMLAPPELKNIHPLGKSPVITDGDLVIAESSAILEYLAATYGAKDWVLKSGTEEALRANYWMHYAEGSAMPPLLLKFVFDRIQASPFPFFVKPIAKKICDKVNNLLITPQLKTHRDFIESELHKTTWFAGDKFTIADIQMSYAVEGFQSRGGLDDNYPKALDWLERIRARSAYKRAVEKSSFK